MSKKPKSSKPTQQDPAKTAAKRARRAERQAQEAEARLKAKRRKKLKVGAAIGVVVIAAGAAGFALYQELFPGELPGVISMPSQGRTHLTVGQSATYETATPTSGSHAASSPGCGVYQSEFPLESAIHALEHGTVVLWYRPDLDAGELAELRALVNAYDNQLILAPNPDLTSPIVATAWNRLRPYSGYDIQIRDFVDTYRDRGPERVDCRY